MIKKEYDPCRRRMTTLASLGVFLVVFSARCWLIAQAGHEVPYWDQWYSDPADIHSVASESFLVGLFDAHNEHRIVFTRILNRVLLAGERQWNPFSQMLAASVIHACAAVVLFLWTSRNSARTQITLIAASIAAVYALPHAWQNTLWGFQSQFSFLLLFSFATLMFLSEASGGKDIRLWFGIVGGTAANLSMAAGIATGGTLCVVVLLEALAERRIRNQFIVRFLSGALLVALGLLLKTTASHQEALQAGNLSQFTAVFVSALAWPLIGWPMLFAFTNAPLLWMTVRSITRKIPWNVRTRISVTLGTWGAMQAAAFAFARGNAAVISFEAASRYHDLLAVLVVANAVALIQLASETNRPSLPARRALATFVAVWIVAVAAGLTNLTMRVEDSVIAAQNNDPYVHTRLLTAIQRGADLEIFDQLPPAFRMWHPPERVSNILNDPELAPWLPPGLHHPIPLKWDTENEAQSLLEPVASVDNIVPRGFYDTWSSSGSGQTNRTGLAESEPINFRNRMHVLSFAYGGNPHNVQMFVNRPEGQAPLHLDLSNFPGDTWEEWNLPRLNDWGTLTVQVHSPDSWVAISGFRASGFGYSLVSHLRKNSAPIWFLLSVGFVSLTASALPTILLTRSEQSRLNRQ